MGKTFSVFTNCLSFCCMLVINSEDSGSDFEPLTRKQKDKLRKRQKRKQKTMDKSVKLRTRKQIKNKKKAAKLKQKRAKERAATHQNRMVISAKKKMAREQRKKDKRQEQKTFQQMTKDEKSKWLDDYDKTYDIWTATEPPHEEYLKAYTKYAQAAMSVSILRVPPTASTQHPPKMIFPLGHQQKACKLCSIFELLRILADIRETPRYLELNFAELYLKLVSYKIWCYKQLKTAGFKRSADGLRFIWTNTQRNRNMVRMLDDYHDARREEEDGLLLYCEHEGLQQVTCWGCGTKLVRIILSDIHKMASKSTFCILHYATVKKEMNGTQKGLNMLFDLGFIRSTNGQQLRWEDTPVNRECIAKAQNHHPCTKWMQVKEHPYNVNGCKHEIVELGVTEEVKMNVYESDEEDKEEIGPPGMSVRICDLIRGTRNTRHYLTQDEIDAKAKEVPEEYRKYMENVE